MSELVVRRLMIDLEQELPRRWCGGDAFRTAVFDALSLSFPVGEQFFIDSVKFGIESLPPEQREALQPTLRAFIGQEATHRRLHALYNAHLERRGVVNAWAARATRRLKRMDDLEVRHWMAATAATEHITAIFAEWLLARPELLDGAEPRLRTLWQWHAAEELEHRSVAFDLYLALQGNHVWRVRFMRLGTVYFALDLARQTLRNLHHDGALWRAATWRSAARFLFGRGGLVRELFGPWRRYFREDFHPAQQSGQRATDWLAAHADAYTVVGAER